MGRAPITKLASNSMAEAVSFTAYINGIPMRVRVNGSNIREGLEKGGIQINSADRVAPSLDTPLSAGLTAYVHKAKAVKVEVDKNVIAAYTLKPTVGEALAEQAISMGEGDRIEPAMDSPVEKDMTIRVIRVSTEAITQGEELEYLVVRQPSADIEVGEEQLVQEGRPGLRQWTTLINYENGEEVGRSVEKEWVESEPVPRVIAYGTKIVYRQMETPYGPISYYRKLRVFATSYNASHGGKPPGHPLYGITATGMTAGRGVIAVDPRVIPLYTRVYVPGYGIAIAGDTGGGIKGMMIDLGFEEEDESMWLARWVDIYLLE
ncbi:MAG: G5 domain-containing protein [Chloroflexi bacterium]|nr:G5 domain-containing protein [Chloroflexota bacterium]